MRVILFSSLVAASYFSSPSGISSPAAYSGLGPQNSPYMHGAPSNPEDPYAANQAPSPASIEKAMAAFDKLITSENVREVLLFLFEGVYVDDQSAEGKPFREFRQLVDTEIFRQDLLRAWISNARISEELYIKLSKEGKPAKDRGVLRAYFTESIVYLFEKFKRSGKGDVRACAQLLYHFPQHSSNRNCDEAFDDWFQYGSVNSFKVRDGLIAWILNARRSAPVSDTWIEEDALGQALYTFEKYKNAKVADVDSLAKTLYYCAGSDSPSDEKYANLWNAFVAQVEHECSFDKKFGEKVLVEYLKRAEVPGVLPTVENPTKEDEWIQKGVYEFNQCKKGGVKPGVLIGIYFIQTQYLEPDINGFPLRYQDLVRMLKAHHKNIPTFADRIFYSWVESARLPAKKGVDPKPDDNQMSQTTFMAIIAGGVLVLGGALYCIKKSWH